MLRPMRRFAGLCLLALSAGCAARVSVPAAPPAMDVIEYVVPWADAFPSDIVVDDGGRVWFTDRLTHAIGRLDPETGEFARFETPTPKSAPYGFVRGPDGAFWFAESRMGRLGRVDPGTGVITEHRLGSLSDGPYLLAVAGGRIWFTVRGGRGYGSYDPASGETAIYPMYLDAPAYGIASDGERRVWVAGFNSPVLLEIDVRTDSVRMPDLTEPDTVLERMLARMPDSLRARYGAAPRRGPGIRRMSAHGGTVWLTDFRSGSVVALRAGTDEHAVYPSVDRQSEPYGILAATSGLVWYNEKRHDVIVALNPATGERTRYRIPTRGAAVRHIAEDAQRHRIWLPLSDRGRIGLIPLRPSAVPLVAGAGGAHD